MTVTVTQVISLLEELASTIMTACARLSRDVRFSQSIKFRNSDTRLSFGRFHFLSPRFEHDLSHQARDDVESPGDSLSNHLASDSGDLSSMARDLKMDKVELAEKIFRHSLKECEGILGSGVDNTRLCSNPCANWSAPGGFACNNAGKILCPSCSLVTYCSLECKQENLCNHKCFCESASRTRQESPAPIRRPANRPALETASDFLWGNVPAYGILGQYVKAPDLPQNVSLCFAASGDIRNVIETVCQLPDEYAGQAIIYINDHNPMIVARNFLMLKLLQTYDYEAIDAVIALWYSAAMTQAQSVVIDGVVLDTLKSTVCKGTHGEFQVDFNPSPGSTLSVEDGAGLWALMARMSASRLSMQSILDCRIEKLNFEQKKFHRKLACLRPPHQVVWRVFWETGLLLPFGAYRAHHISPNKFLLHPSAGWMMSGDANPINGWNITDVLATASIQRAPRSDLFGSLFFHLKKKLATFIRKVQTCKVHLKLSCKDASCLAVHLSDHNIRLHCVDTSNIADVNYGGIKPVLLDWGPLLDRTSGFKSTLITYFMNWVYFDAKPTLPSATLSKLTWTDIEAVVELMSKRSESDSKRLMELLDIGNSCGNISILNYFHDFNASFTSFLNSAHAEAAAAGVGLELRRNHLVVPHRFAVGPGDSNGIPGMNASYDQCYYDCMVGDLSFTERIVEWGIR